MKTFSPTLTLALLLGGVALALANDNQGTGALPLV
jgi:hypothetical protein